MPKVNRERAQRVERQAYPGRLRARTDGCWRLRLSDDAGLTQFGVGEVELMPGASTGLYHWHEREDELVYVLQGQVVMVEGDKEHVLGPGDSAGFRAGVTVGHTFENRTDSPARILEIGLRHPEGETAHYPGFDMRYRREGSSSPVRFETLDGVELSPSDEVRRVEDPQNLKPRSPLDID